MINAIYFLIPEIFLSLSVFVFIIFGVFKKNSFDLIYKATIIIIPIVIFLILNNNFSDHHIIKNTIIPAGAGLEIDTTDIRIDTSTGKDSLRIKCSNANGVYVIINN